MVTRGALLTLGVTVALGAACGKSSSMPDASDAFDRKALLVALGTNVVRPTLADFAWRTDEVLDTITAWCQALGEEGESEALTAAQESWRHAMAEWQEAEVMRFGPATMQGGAPRDQIYSWPVLSGCAVDQEVMVLRADPSGHSLATALTNRRGLAPLEYLLFRTELTLTCAPQAAPVGWSELNDADKRAARCNYAIVVADDLKTNAEALANAWDPAQGNYVQVLGDGGESGSPFANAQAALNVVSDAMFYIEQETKDRKLSRAAGITSNSCGVIQEACVADLENPWSSSAKESLRGNMLGFRNLFTGVRGENSGPGFDDLLIAVDAELLATEMLAATDDVLDELEAFEGTLAGSLAENRDPAVSLHTKIRALTDLMKSQFLTVLGLDLPDELGDDTD